MRAEFRLLGPVELRLDRRAVDLGPAKQRCVLAALLWSSGQPVTVETLLGRVWGEPAPARKRDSLYSYVTRLRSVLGPAGVPLTRTAAGYLAEVDPALVDLCRYRCLVRRARSTGMDPRSRAGLLHAALSLWYGKPLGGLPGDWAQRASAGLVQQHVALLAEWAALEMSHGTPTGVIEVLADARVSYPLAEPLVEQLMLALRGTGQASEALGLYRRYRAELTAELGLEPSRRLRELELLLLRGDVRPVGQGGGAEPAPPRSTPPPRPVPYGAGGAGQWLW